MNVDLHFHHTPRFFLDELRGENPWGKQVVAKGDELVLRFGAIAMALTSEHWDVARTLQVMDAQRIDLAGLSPSPILFHTQWPADAVLALHRRVNDELAQIGRAHPKRFAPIGTVPPQDPAAAVRELERCMAIGLHGIEIETNAAGKNLDEPSLRPLFAAAESLGALVFLHPLVVLGAERMRAYYLSNLLGNPTDTAVAIASLIFGGVLDAHPDLKIVCAHGGGSAPALCGRWDHGARVRPELSHLKRLPSDALRQLHYDSLTHSNETLEFLVRAVGAERVVVGSDYPYDMGDPRAVERIEKAPFLSPAQRELVLGQNALRLLGEDVNVKVDGRCHCGRITYEAEIDPARVGICHCTDCQMLTGSAYRVSVQAPADTFRLLSGQPKFYVKTAESGNKRIHSFCGDCGTPVHAAALENTPTYSLRIGCLRQRAELPPKRQIWCDSAVPWSSDLAAIAKSPRQ